MKTISNTSALFLVSAALLLGSGACRDTGVTQQVTNTEGTPTVPASQAGVRNDMRIVLHEEMINKLFKSLGTITGKGTTTISFTSLNYSWTVTKPQIRLRPGKADFLADVNVKAGPIDYTSNIVGDVAVSYNSKKNTISIKVTKALFEIYTTVFGTKYHITNYDLAQYFKDPFDFDGPAGMETDFDFTMPDNSVRKIWMKPTDCNVVVEDHQIVIPCETSFYQKQ